MARKLPWVKDTDTASTNKSSSRTKRSNKSTNPTTPKQRTSRDRSPSSSPLASPPPVLYMREGLGKDDRWIMVEDEFLTTARRFTAHLHHAEYKRMEAAARSRNAGAISRMTRGDVKDDVSALSKRRIEQEDAAEARDLIVQTSKTGEAEEGGNGDDDEIIPRDSRLAGLMARKREPSVLLSNLMTKEPRTRTSPGSPGAKKTPTFPQTRHRDSMFLRLQEEQSTQVPLGEEKAESRDLHKKTALLGPLNLQHRSSTQIPELPKSPEKSPDGETGPKPTTSTFAERRAKRKAQQAKKEAEEAKTKKIQLLEVPTFLI